VQTTRGWNSSKRISAWFHISYDMQEWPSEVEFCIAE
jgi:hypothetical protein